jgi:hypothetical protein
MPSGALQISLETVQSSLKESMSGEEPVLPSGYFGLPDSDNVVTARFGTSLIGKVTFRNAADH